VRNAFARVVSRAVAVSLLFAGSAQSQASVQLAFSGPPVSFASPTVADYTAARLETTAPLPFQISTTSEPTGSFTTTVYIRSSSATLGGGKSVADMEWRRGDESTWRALTTTDAIVESRVSNGTAQGHSWDNTIYFRIALRWTSDPPAIYTGDLVITVSTTQP